MKWSDQSAYLAELQILRNALCREQDAVQVGHLPTEDFANALVRIARQRRRYRALTVDVEP